MQRYRSSLRPSAAAILSLTLIAACGGGGGDGGSGQTGSAGSTSTQTQDTAAPVAFLKWSAPSTSTLLLDASLSTAPSTRRIVRFEWRVDGAPPASRYAAEVGEVAATDAARPSIEVPIDVTGTYHFALRVYDGVSYSRWVTLEITVTVFPPVSSGSPPITTPAPAPAPEPLPNDPQSAARVAELPAYFVAADFDRVGGRLVIVGDDRRLHIQDFEEPGGHRVVDLPKAATSVAVDPRGGYAIVGHDALVSHVDLVSGRMVGTHQVAMSVSAVAFGPRGTVYAFPGGGVQWTRFVALDLGTGLQTESIGGLFYGGSAVGMHPSGDYLYSSSNSLSPTDLDKYDLRAAAPARLYDSPYHGDYPVCGGIWYSTDGARIFSGCGTVFNSSEVQATDMRYAGSIGNQPIRVASLDSHITRDRVLTIPEVSWYSDDKTLDQQVRIFDYRFLQPVGLQAMPTYDHPGGRDRLHGRALFIHPDGRRYFVVASPTDGHLAGFRTVLLQYSL